MNTLVMNDSDTVDSVAANTMHNRVVMFLCIALGMTILGWFYSQGGGGGIHGALINKKAPEFTVTDEKGKKVHLSDFKGQAIMLHFWASWCPPCRSEFPYLNALYKDIKSKDIVLLAVSLDEGGKDDVAKFKKNVSFDFPIYYNPSQDVADLYGTYGLPETFLINKEGTIVKKFIGPQNWGSEAMKAEISAVSQ